MNLDLAEQEDELLALQSIFNSEEFFRDQSKPVGESRVSPELPAGFTVLLKEGDTLRQYEISSLPPLVLTFELPEDYPSFSHPSFTINCSWLTNTQLSALSSQLVDLYKDSGGAVILFTWVQFLREEALRFLDIHNELELPTDGDDPNPGLSESESEPHSVSKAAENTGTSETFTPSLNVPSNPSDTVRQTDAEDQEGSSKEEDVSTSFPLSRSSDPSDPRTQGAASTSLHSWVSPDEDWSFSVTPSQALLSQILIHDATQKQKAFDSSLFDCGICFFGWLGSQCIQLSECGHVFCQSCFREFCNVQIAEGNVRGVTCPQGDCTASPTPAQVESLVGEKLFSRYDRLLLQDTLDCMPDVIYCPRKFCGLAVIQEKSGSAALCSVCGFAFCVKCRKTYHGEDDCPQEKKIIIKGVDDNTLVDVPESKEGKVALWDDYISGSKERKRVLESRYGRNISNVSSVLSEDWISSNCKHCPHCLWKIQKNGGCHMMFCTHCQRSFCWVCLSKFNSYQYYIHDPSCPYYLPPP